MTGDRVTKVDAVLKKTNRLKSEVQELKEENDELRRRLSQIEEVVDPDPESKEYDRMNKPEKVRAVRKAVIRKALNTQGNAGSMTYDEIMALFGNHPSAGHAYNLMKAAAEMQGFGYDNAGSQGQGQKRVRVDIPSVKDEGLIQSVNKTIQEKATA